MFDRKYDLFTSRVFTCSCRNVRREFPVESEMVISCFVLTPETVSGSEMLAALTHVEIRWKSDVLAKSCTVE